MSKGRFKNIAWDLSSSSGNISTWQNVEIAVLMDLRDEMQEANRHLRTIAHTLGCPRFLNLPTAVDKIVKNTMRKPLKKKEAS